MKAKRNENLINRKKTRGVIAGEPLKKIPLRPQTSGCKMLRSEEEFIKLLQANKIYYFKYTKAKKGMERTYQLGQPINRTIIFTENEGYHTYVSFMPPYIEKKITDRCVIELPYLCLKSFVLSLEKYEIIKRGKLKVIDRPLQKLVPHAVYSVKMRGLEKPIMGFKKSNCRWHEKAPMFQCPDCGTHR